MLKPGMQEIILGVHNGIFHADDVLCAILVDIVMRPKKLTIYRTRDKQLLNKCNFILDVGKTDMITNTQVWFDHHQEKTTDKDYYNNGIKKAACGKLFEWLWDNNYFIKHYNINIFNLLLQCKIKDKILEKIFYPIESMDNGQTIKDLENNKFTFVNSMLPPYNNQSDEELKSRFIQVVQMGKQIFNNLISVIIEECKASDKVLDIINKTSNSEILLLDEYYPWMDTVIKYNKIHNNKKKLVIFKDANQGYMLQTIPIGNPEDKFQSFIDLPEVWAGKSGKELEDVSGIKGAVFCHPGRFISGWNTLDEAIEAANKVLYS